MKRINGLFILIVILLMVSCEDLFNTDKGGLTTEEVIEGLKTALVVGTDSSVAVTSAQDGYYRDPIIKIFLPEEADVILNNLDNQVFHTLGLTTVIDQQVEKVILSVNRAAEDAASGAAPIFKQSISDLSITDAWAILKGKNPAANTKSSGDFDSTAATAYLKSTTYNSLVNLYSPPVVNALSKDLGLGFSADDAWNTLTSLYNQGAESLAGQLAGLEPVDIELDEYVVGKALDGLFFKVGEEEKKIRKNPLEWATTAVGEILEKVFGSQDK